MTVSATRRVSIRWLPEAAYEDTDTLVLSVHEYFVDVRVKKDYATIDWAFAGTKEVESDGRHVWTHLIDSRGSLDQDAGYVSLLPNGDELETGTMRHPESGSFMRHEEVWRSLPVENATGFVAESQTDPAWIAMVDNHLLFIAVGHDGVTVARYVRYGNSWTKIFSIGQDPLLDGLEELPSENLKENSTWRILAQEDLS